jgi:REP element-mobilizing transposase RayT
VVFIPKYRRKVLYGELRRHLGDVFRKLALQKEGGHVVMGFRPAAGTRRPSA